MQKLHRATLCVGLAVLACSGVARAGESAAVVRVQLEGAPDSDRLVLEKLVREALAEKVAVVPAARTADVLKSSPAMNAACGDSPTCLSEQGRALDARFLVRGAIKNDNSDYTGELSLDDAALGKHLETVPIQCDACGWVEAQSAVKKAAAILASRAAIEKPATVKKSEIPSTPPVVATSEPRPALRILKWVTLAGAVGAIAAGAVMLAYNNRCTIDVPPDAAARGAMCPTRYDTAIEGGVFVGVGGALAATSVALFVLDRKPQPTTLTPSVTATPSGAQLTLRLDF